MSSIERFAYPLSSSEDLTPPVRAAMKEALLPDETVRQIIFAPRQSHLALGRGLWARLSTSLSEQWTPDWVLALTEERLLLATIVDRARPPQISATWLADCSQSCLPVETTTSTHDHNASASHPVH